MGISRSKENLYYLGENQSNYISFNNFYLGVKILIWYIDLHDIKNKIIFKHPYPIGIKNTIVPIQHLHVSMLGGYCYWCQFMKDQDDDFWPTQEKVAHRIGISLYLRNNQVELTHEYIYCTWR